MFVLLAAVNFVFAEEITDENLLNQPDSDTISEESAAVPTAADIQSGLNLLEKTTPIMLKINETANLISGSEINVKADVGIFTQVDTSQFGFKWFLKKDGLDQSVVQSSQGKGKNQFVFMPSSSGNYEVRAEATDPQGNTRESQPLLLGVGDNFLITFDPLKPANGQRVGINVSGFSNGVSYRWFLDGKEQIANGSKFDFIVSKSFGQAHKVRISTSNKEGLVSTKEILIPVYRPEVFLKPVTDGIAIAGQAGSLNEFLIKDGGPIILNAGDPNFMDADEALYVWYLNGEKIDEGMGKKSVYIDPENEILKNSQNGEYKASVMVSSPDSKHIALGNVKMERISPNSSLAAASPEKVSNSPLLAESKSFFSSLGTIRKLILPMMIVMFVVVIALGGTQPQKIE